MTEQNTTHTENLHKRLSMMENEINELNEILQENLDNSHKINYLNDDVIINDQHDQEIDDLKNVIINDKIDIMDDLEKAESPEPEQKEAQKVNNNWAVYTNQEGRRIHEIPVMQKVKELEQNPTSPVKEMSYKRSPTKINTTATGEDEKMVAVSPTKSKTPSISEQQMIMPPTPKEAVAPSVKEEHKELIQPLKEVIPPKVLETPVIEDQTPKVEESSVIKDQTPKVEESSVIKDQTPKADKSSVIEEPIPKEIVVPTVVEEPLSKAVSPEETPLNDYKLASTRKTKNPFRVVSVSKGKELSPEISNPETFINVDPAKQTFLENVDTIEAETAYEETEMPNDIDILLKLYDHICEKINKLGSEIEYVNNIIESRYSYSLTYDELKQFKKGKVILQRYLDKKYKQKYELENKISLKFRQLKLDDKMNSSLFFGNK